MVAAGPLVIITIGPDNTASSDIVVTMTVVALVASIIFISSSCSLARVSASRAPKGSSIQQHLGLIDRARAMPTLLHAAGNFMRVFLLLAWSRPTRLMAAAVRSFQPGLAFPGAEDALDGGMTFSKQVSQGNRLWFWKTTARSGPGPAISRPSQSRTPVVSVGPAIRLSSVDLPQPEWPISAMNSPPPDGQVDVAQGDEALLGIESLAHVFDL